LIIAIKRVVGRDLSAELNAPLDLLNFSSFLQHRYHRGSSPGLYDQIDERQRVKGSGCAEARLANHL
jgi:hypothetical protein